MTAYPDLSPREQQVGALVARGFTDKQIGAELGIAYHTVRTYVVAVAFKLHIPGGQNTRVLIARWWMKHHPHLEPGEIDKHA